MIAAAKELKIEIQSGFVTEIICKKEKIQSLKTSIGKLEAEHYVLATGPWSQELLPIPIFPTKWFPEK